MMNDRTGGDSEAGSANAWYPFAGAARARVWKTGSRRRVLWWTDRALTDVLLARSPGTDPVASAPGTKEPGARPQRGGGLHSLTFSAKRRSPEGSFDLALKTSVRNPRDGENATRRRDSDPSPLPGLPLPGLPASAVPPPGIRVSSVGRNLRRGKGLWLPPDQRVAPNVRGTIVRPRALARGHVGLGGTATAVVPRPQGCRAPSRWRAPWRGRRTHRRRGDLEAVRTRRGLQSAGDPGPEAAAADRSCPWAVCDLRSTQARRCSVAAKTRKALIH